jgi:hypothetical protein
MNAVLPPKGGSITSLGKKRWFLLPNERSGGWGAPHPPLLPLAKNERSVALSLLNERSVCAIKSPT